MPSFRCFNQGMTCMAQWQESYTGGSLQAELASIEQFACDMRDIHARIAARTGEPGNRTLHAKIIAGFQNARLTMHHELPADLYAGYMAPGETYSASVRFSNASPVCVGDGLPDMRGAAMRVRLGDDNYHDLLMTSFPVSHARHARQFVEVAKIATGPKALILPRLVLSQGLSETRRILRNIRSGSKPCESIATLQFWSRAPLLWGEAGPVRYTLIPVASINGVAPDLNNPDHLSTELATRLATGDVTFHLAVQRYVDAARTPIEDGAAEWREADSPFIPIATLTIPRQDMSGAAYVIAKNAVNGMAFNPWNCPPPFRPLGSLNRARGRVYAMSAEAWLGAPPPRLNSAAASR